MLYYENFKVKSPSTIYNMHLINLKSIWSPGCIAQLIGEPSQYAMAEVQSPVWAHTSSNQ